MLLALQQANNFLASTQLKPEDLLYSDEKCFEKPPPLSVGEKRQYKDGAAPTSPDQTKRRPQCDCQSKKNTHGPCLLSGKKTGSLNTWQREWIDAIAKGQVGKKQVYVRPIPPHTRSKDFFSEFLKFCCLKPVYKIDFEACFGINVIEKLSSCCKKPIKASGFSTPKLVFDITEDAYVIEKLYQCSSCKKTIDIHELKSIEKAAILLPIQKFERSAITTELWSEICFNTTTSKTTSGLAKRIARHRTSDYIRKRAIYNYYVEYFGERDRLYEPFPAFFGCKYNGTLGPTENFLINVERKTIVDQFNFLRRTMGGMTEERLSGDHTCKVPAAMKIRIDNKEVSAFNFLHCLMNSKGQFVSACYTNTTNDHERLGQATELYSRYYFRGKDLRVYYSDNCCTDTFLRARFPDLRCRMDIAHILNRYKEATSRTCDSTDRSVFMRKLSACITPLGKKAPLEPGEVIYNRIAKLLSDWEKKEITEYHCPKRRVLCPQTWKTHKNQEYHIKNCLYSQCIAERPYTYSRFGEAYLRRGNNYLESSWRILKRNFPERVDFQRGVLMVLATMVEHNMSREVITNCRWPCLPISFSVLALVQKVVYDEARLNLNKNPTSEDFQLLPLSHSNSTNLLDLVYGISTRIETGSTSYRVNVSEETVDATEKVISISENRSSSKVLDWLSIKLLLEMGDTLTEESNLVVEKLPKKRIRVHNSQMGHSTGKRRKMTLLSNVLSLGMKKETLDELLGNYDEIAQTKSPILNYCEASCLRFLLAALGHCEHHYDIAGVDVSSISWKKLHKFWNILHESAKRSKMKSARLIRYKTESVLKKNVTSLISVHKFDNIGESSSNGKMPELLASWNALSSKILLDSDSNESQGYERATITEEVIAPKQVKQFSISKLHAEVLDSRRMVNQKRSIPWKQLRGEWKERGVPNSFMDAVFKFHKKHLKAEHYKNKTEVQESLVPESSVVEFPEEVEMAQIAETIVSAVSKTDFSCNVCSFKIPSTEKPNDLAIIKQVEVSIAEKQQMYSQLENKLLLHILNCEHDMIRGNGKSRNWRKLKLRWVYWVKVYVYCTGNRSTIYERSEQSLKERQKKLHKNGATVQKKTVTSFFRNSNCSS
mmetsp:Transcript_2214/g.2536  ORF Transcript_2214/g.2536 Transcript_2214/m.2536 type:complete len:1112 (-) Transcript_2214:84-3419(-)